MGLPKRRPPRYGDLGPCVPVLEEPGAMIVGAGGNWLSRSERANSCRYIGSYSYAARLYGIER